MDDREAITHELALAAMDERDHLRREVEQLRDLLTEAHRQDFGTQGWRERVRRACDLVPRDIDRH